MSWLLQQWNELLDASDVASGPWQRQMRVQRLEVSNGIITAQVATRTAGTCALRIAWPPLNDREWNRILDLLSGQALFSAQLLAGELPAEIQKLFDEADLPLLPDDLSEWRVVEARCEENEAPSDEQIEQAAAVVYAALGELFDEDPWLLFHMRGRNKHQLLQALRDRRHEPGNGTTVPEWSAAASSATPSAEPGGARTTPVPDVAPLFSEAREESEVDEFWGANKRPQNVHYRIEPPAIDRALLRRLGPPPFAQDSSVIYETLSAIYTQVSNATLAMAYATDVDDTDAADADIAESRAVDATEDGATLNGRNT